MSTAPAFASSWASRPGACRLTCRGSCCEGHLGWSGALSEVRAAQCIERGASSVASGTGGVAATAALAVLPATALVGAPATQRLAWRWAQRRPQRGGALRWPQRWPQRWRRGRLGRCGSTSSIQYPWRSPRRVAGYPRMASFRRSSPLPSASHWRRFVLAFCCLDAAASSRSRCPWPSGSSAARAPCPPSSPAC